MVTNDIAGDVSFEFEGIFAELIRCIDDPNESVCEAAHESLIQFGLRRPEQVLLFCFRVIERQCNEVVGHERFYQAAIIEAYLQHFGSSEFRIIQVCHGKFADNDCGWSRLNTNIMFVSGNIVVQHSENIMHVLPVLLSQIMKYLSEPVDDTTRTSLNCHSRTLLSAVLFNVGSIFSLTESDFTIVHLPKLLSLLTGHLKKSTPITELAIIRSLNILFANLFRRYSSIVPLAVSDSTRSSTGSSQCVQLGKLFEGELDSLMGCLFNQLLLSSQRRSQPNGPDETSLTSKRVNEVKRAFASLCESTDVVIEAYSFEGVIVRVTYIRLLATPCVHRITSKEALNLHYPVMVTNDIAGDVSFEFEGIFAELIRCIDDPNESVCEAAHESLIQFGLRRPEQVLLFCFRVIERQCNELTCKHISINCHATLLSVIDTILVDKIAELDIDKLPSGFTKTMCRLLDMKVSHFNNQFTSAEDFTKPQLLKLISNILVHLSSVSYKCVMENLLTMIVDGQGLNTNIMFVSGNIVVQHSENIMHVLPVLLSQIMKYLSEPVDDTTRTSLNCTHYPERVLHFTQSHLYSGPELSRAVTMELLRHLIASCDQAFSNPDLRLFVLTNLRHLLFQSASASPPTIRHSSFPKQNLMGSLVKASPLGRDQSGLALGEVAAGAHLPASLRYELVKLVSTLGGAGYLTLDGGQHTFIEFIIRQCAMPLVGSDKTSSAGPSQVEIRHLCARVLKLCSLTVPSMQSLMWPFVLEFVTMPECTEAIGVLCECIAHLTSKQSSDLETGELKLSNGHRASAVDMKQLSTTFTPHRLLARLLVLLGHPTSDDNRGFPILRAMHCLASLFHTSLPPIWDLVIPRMSIYLAQDPDDSTEINTVDHNEQPFSQTHWEHLTQKVRSIFSLLVCMCSSTFLKFSPPFCLNFHTNVVEASSLRTSFCQSKVRLYVNSRSCLGVLFILHGDSCLRASSEPMSVCSCLSRSHF
ncbi:hypothetical protein AHF37_05611 [Paragonimus kellicotti]|nr:hypothetical protein AHF37_05611 [Paragonimus kellicotti]